jgi:hypothetical protein
MYIYRAREESEEKRKEKKDIYMIVLYTQIITHPLVREKK